MTTGGPPPPPPPPNDGSGGPPPPPGQGAAGRPALPQDLSDERDRIEAEVEAADGGTVRDKRARLVVLKKEFNQNFKRQHAQLVPLIKGVNDVLDLLAKKMVTRPNLINKFDEIVARLDSSDEFTLNEIKTLEDAIDSEVQYVQEIIKRIDESDPDVKNSKGTLVDKETEFDSKLAATGADLQAAQQKSASATSPEEKALHDQAVVFNQEKIRRLEAERLRTITAIKDELAKANQILQACERIKPEVGFKTKKPYQNVFTAIERKYPAIKKATGKDQSGDVEVAVDVKANEKLWRDVFSGGGLLNAIKFVALDEEELYSLSADNIMDMLQKFTENKFGKNITVLYMLAIATGYLQHEEFGCNHLNPLEGAVTNPDNKKLFETYVERFTAENPELAPPNIGAGAGQVSAADLISESVADATSPDTKRDQSAAEAGVPEDVMKQARNFMGSLRKTVTGRGDKSEVDSPPQTRKDAQLAALSALDAHVHDVNIAGGAGRVLDEAGIKGPAKAAVIQALDEEPANAAEAAIFQGILQSILDAPESDIPDELRALSQAKSQQLVMGLAKEVEKLQTPENLLAGGDLKAALLRMKQVNGSDPTLAAARNLVASVCKGNRSAQIGYTQQLQATLAEVAKIDVKEDTTAKNRPGRR